MSGKNLLKSEYPSNPFLILRSGGGTWGDRGKGKKGKVKGKRKEKKGSNPFLIIRSGGGGGVEIIHGTSFVEGGGVD